MKSCVRVPEHPLWLDFTALFLNGFTDSCPEDGDCDCRRKQSKWPKYLHGTLDSIEVALVRKGKEKREEQAQVKGC